jgi:hypothetical protein
VRYPLAVLARGVYHQNRFTSVTKTREAKNVSGSRRHLPLFVSAVADLLDESAEPNENVLREAFFRKFTKLDPNDQKKIAQMIDAWRKKS